MRVTELDFFREAQKFIALGASFGWHERNAGNVSLYLNESEIAPVLHGLDLSAPAVPLARHVPEMDGEFVFTTVTGSYFTDMDESSFCVCRVTDSGRGLQTVWGKGKPTSEINGHLLSLAAFKRAGDGRRAVYHCHPADLVVLTGILPLDDKTFTQALWSALTECPFVFPRGVGVVGFYIPGSAELADATAASIARRDAVVWAHHGLFASGTSIKDAFGVAHTVAKAAEIRLKIISSGKETLNSPAYEQLKQTAEYYGKSLNVFE